MSFCYKARIVTLSNIGATASPSIFCSKWNKKVFLLLKILHLTKTYLWQDRSTDRLHECLKSTPENKRATLRVYPMQIKTCQERPRGPSAEGYKYHQEESDIPLGVTGNPTLTSGSHSCNSEGNGNWYTYLCIQVKVLLCRNIKQYRKWQEFWKVRKLEDKIQQWILQETGWEGMHLNRRHFYISLIFR